MTLHLQSVDQLFNAPGHLNLVASRVEGGAYVTTGRLISGMEELILELTPRKVRGGVQLTLMLPSENIEGDSHAQVLDAIVRYCELRLRQTQLELEAQRREGLSALRVGSLLFLLGIAVSYILTRNSIPDTVQAVFGNGIFLLIAWLGLWWPLDLLVFLRGPLVRRRRVLRALEGLELRLVAEEEIATDGSVPSSSEHAVGGDVARDAARPRGDDAEAP